MISKIDPIAASRMHRALTKLNASVSAELCVTPTPEVAHGELPVPTPHTHRTYKLWLYQSEPTMPTLVEELSARAKTLPRHDRARLAEELLDSLQGDSDAEADAAWDREIERRVAEIETGTVKLISAEDVHAEARRLIRR